MLVALKCGIDCHYSHNLHRVRPKQSFFLFSQRGHGACFAVWVAGNKLTVYMQLLFDPLHLNRRVLLMGGFVTFSLFSAA